MKSRQKCGFSNDDMAKFCKNCGQELMDSSSAQFCKQCGSPIVPGTKFCKQCGTPVGSRTEPVQNVKTTEKAEPGKMEPKRPEPKRPEPIKAGSANNTKVIGIAAIALVILLVVIVVATRKPKDEYYGDAGDYYGDTSDYGDDYGDDNYGDDYDYDDGNYGDVSGYDDDNYGDDYDYDDGNYGDDNYGDDYDYDDGDVGDYILEGSDYTYLSKSDLYGLTAEQCRIARNEIYARYGRKFDDEELQEYFNSCSWYYPSVEPDEFDESWLNDYEVANRDLIVEYEKEMGYR